MATNIVHAPHASTLWAAIWKRLKHGKGRGGIARAKRRLWFSASADPACDKAEYLSAPVAAGDFAYRLDSDEVFICTTGVAVATSAVFAQIV